LAAANHIRIFYRLQYQGSRFNGRNRFIPEIKVRGYNKKRTTQNSFPEDRPLIYTKGPFDIKKEQGRPFSG
ncbi:MAG: hypothetical protein KGY46_10610, partial [Anaerolineales bacterium]|nr:hypothetical protein [Anaerolineales bacterium]